MRKRRAGALLLIVCGAALSAYVLTHVPPASNLLQPVELTTLDWRVRSASPSLDDSPVVLVLFDSASVSEWAYLVPFPRSVLASLVEIVAAKGARAMALDVYLDRRYPLLESLDSGDSRLRSSIARAGNVVLAGRSVAVGETRALLPPDPYFAGAAAAVGVADLPSPHEVVREATLLVKTADGPAPGLALALFGTAHGLDLDSLVTGAASARSLSIPSIPRALAGIESTDPVLNVPLRFLGPPSRPGESEGAFRAFSASMLLRLGDAVPEEWFRDRIVLLGTGFHPEDRFRSPFYDVPDASGAIRGWTYGTEVHATAFQNLLRGGYPLPPPGWAEVALLALLALVTAAATFSAGAVWGVGAGVTCLGVAVASAWYLFDSRAIHLPIVSSTLAVALSIVASTGYVSLFEGRQKRMIRRAFSRYLSPDVVDQLVADPSALRLGGERRPVSVIFSDLAGFTALSESTDPERLLSLLSEYLDAMTRVVVAERGTLDKYMGDAVMAFFGAPTSQPDHALRACRTAILMQRRVRELSREWAVAGWPELQVRIGIHTGNPVVGNIGGEHRFDYTVLGDDVNLASRLEGACREYQVGILASDETIAAAGEAIVARELDTITVKGRSRPVRVYEVIGLSCEVGGSRDALLHHFAAGLIAYRRGEVDKAIGEFQEVERLVPGDGPSLLYLRRCLECSGAGAAEEGEHSRREVPI